MIRTSIPGFILGAAACMFAHNSSAFAATYYYADWTSAAFAVGGPSSVMGSLTSPDGTLTLSYSGDLASSTQINNTGVNYYAGYPAVYQNGTVSNLPTRTDLIALSETYTATPNSLTFSTPVVNPILDIVSLGAPSNAVTYNFNATPIILSQGAAYFGGCSTCLSVTGNSLRGTEGSGVIEFVGTFSSLSWTTTGGEYWNGFTVGIAGSGAPTVPEPSTTALAAIGSAGLLWAVRRARAGVASRQVGHEFFGE